MRNLLFSLCLLAISCAPASYSQRLTSEIGLLVAAGTLSNTESYAFPGRKHERELNNFLKALAKQKIVVTFDDLTEQRYMGITVCPYVGDSPCTIGIDTNQDLDSRLATLFHEYAHVKHGGWLSQPAAEVISETVALKAGEAIKLGNRPYSLAYLSTFPEQFRELVYSEYLGKVDEWAKEEVAMTKD